MKSGRTMHVDFGQLTMWFAESRPGEKLIYAIGNIAMDRGGVFDPLNTVASTVMEWEYKRFVCLVQQRSASNEFTYIVVRRAPVDAWDHQRIRNERASLASRAA